MARKPLVDWLWRVYTVYIYRYNSFVKTGTPFLPPLTALKVLDQLRERFFTALQHTYEGWWRPPDAVFRILARLYPAAARYQGCA